MNNFKNLLKKKKEAHHILLYQKFNPCYRFQFPWPIIVNHFANLHYVSLQPVNNISIFFSTISALCSLHCKPTVFAPCLIHYNLHFILSIFLIQQHLQGAIYFYLRRCLFFGHFSILQVNIPPTTISANWQN